MSTRAPDEDACPVCGQAYDRRIVVERGDEWADLYPGSPFDFFNKYRRRCTADASLEPDANLGRDQRLVYFHGGRSGASFF